MKEEIEEETENQVNKKKLTEKQKENSQVEVR